MVWLDVDGDDAVGAEEVAEGVFDAGGYGVALRHGDVGVDLDVEFGEIGVAVAACAQAVKCQDSWHGHYALLYLPQLVGGQGAFEQLVNRGAAYLDGRTGDEKCYEYRHYGVDYAPPFAHEIGHGDADECGD